MSNAKDTCPPATPRPTTKVRHTPALTPPPPLGYTPFPTGLLPPAAAGIVRATAASIGCDEACVALAAVSVLAGVIGNARNAVVKSDWTEPCIVWAVLISPSGTAKTPAAAAVLAPLHKRHAALMEANKDAAKAHAAELKRYKAKLTLWERKPDGDPPAEPDPPPTVRVIVEDTTVEALAPILADNPRGVTLHRDELAGWFGSFDRYAKHGGGDVPRWLSIHNAQAITVDRRTSGTVYVPRPAVSLYGGIQPDRFAKLLTPELRGSGLLPRLVVAQPPPRPKRFNPNGIDATAADAWQRLLNLLMTLDMAADADGRPVPLAVRMIDAARDAFGQWADALNTATLDKPPDVAACRSKLEAYAVRFALIFAVCELAALIDAEHVRRGCMLADWFAAEAERVYDAGDYAAEDADAAELATFIARRGGRVTMGDVTGSGPRKYRGRAGSPSAAAVLERLEAAGRVRREYARRTPAGRGPPALWFVLGGGGNGNELTAGGAADGESISISDATGPPAGVEHAA